MLLESEREHGSADCFRSGKPVRFCARAPTSGQQSTWDRAAPVQLLLHPSPQFGQPRVRRGLGNFDRDHAGVPVALDVGARSFFGGVSVSVGRGGGSCW